MKGDEVSAQIPHHRERGRDDVMGPYFHARWYVDADGLLQRRTAIDQQRIEEAQVAAEDLAAAGSATRTTHTEGETR